MSGMTTYWAGVNGPTHMRTKTDDGPPRLLGHDCGCKRYREGDWWVIEYCDRHAQEIAKHPDRA